MQPFAYSPTQDDLFHAVLSDAVYSAMDPSLGNQSWQRVNKYISSNDIKQQIGSGWRVVVDNKLHHLSSQDAVVVENRALGKVIILCRGTSSLFRDLLINDVGGYFGMGRRVSTTLNSVGLKAQEYADRHGLSLSVAGHSLGGSVAEAVAGVLHVPVFTFNAPQLRHNIPGEYSDARSANSHNVRAWRLEGDLISVLGGLPLDLRNNHTTTLHSTLNPAQAHRMTTLLKEMLRGTPPMQTGPGRGSDDGVHVRLPVQLVLEKHYTEKSFEGDFSWKKDYTEKDAFGHRDVMIRQSGSDFQIKSGVASIDYLRTMHRIEEGNVFFTRVTSTYSVEDSKTHKVISREIETEFKLSMHVVSALASSRVAFVNGTLTGLLGKDTSIHLRPLLASSGETLGKTWLTSVTSSQLTHLLDTRAVPGLGGLGSLVAQVGIDAAFTYLHGDHSAALRGALDSLASGALQYVTGLSYHTTNQVFTGQLFGTGMLYSRETARELGFGGHSLPGGLNELLGQVGAGIMVNHITDVYRLHSGQIVQREASGVGMYAKASVFAGSVGLYRGVEVYQPLTREYTDRSGHAIVRTEGGQRTFSGQFIARFSVCNRVASLAIGPAWHSRTERYWEEHRKDGSAYSEVFGLANQHLSNGPSEAAGLPTYTEYANTVAAAAAAQSSGSGGVYTPGAAQSGGAAAPDVPTGGVAPSDPTGASVPTAIQTSSAIGFSNHRADHSQYMARQGRNEAVTSYTHDEYTERHGATKRTVKHDYAKGHVHEEHATQQTTIEGHRVTTKTVLQEVDQDFSALVHDYDKSFTMGVEHRGNKEHWYNTQQLRQYGTAVYTTNELISEYTDDNSSLAFTESDVSDTVHVARSVQERLTHNAAGPSGRASEMYEEGLLTTTTDGGTTSADDTTTGLTTTHHIVDVAFDQFADKMYESKNGVEVRYAPGENQVSREHVGDTHVDDSFTTNTDKNVKLSGDHKVGETTLNGIDGEAVMDVYALQHTEVTSSNRHRNEDGTLSAEAIDVTTTITDKVHGTFAITKKGEEYKVSSQDLPESMRTADGEGITLMGTAVTATSQVNNIVSGMASSTTQAEGVTYGVGEKDLKLDSTTLIKQTINSYVATEGAEPLVTENVHSQTLSKHEEVTSGDYYSRADDVTTQKLDVSEKTGDPTKTIADLADLSLDEGGSLDPAAKKNPEGVKGEVSRTRILSGMHVERHHVHTAEGRGLGVRVVDDYDDIYSAVSKEATIESGYADNAVLKDDAKVTYGDPTVANKMHVTQDVKFFSFTNKVTTEKYSVNLKDNSESKHETSTKYSASPGAVRASAGAAGALTTIMLECIEKQELPDAKSCGNFAISVLENGLIGQTLAVAQVAECAAAGVGGVMGIAIVSAGARIALDHYYPDEEAKKRSPGQQLEMDGVNVATSVTTTALQAIAATSVVQVVAAVGATIGGGMIMAVPLVVDILKTGYLMHRGLMDWEKGWLNIANRAAGLVVGGLASWGTTALVTGALGVAAATTGGVLAVACAGAVVFSVAAYAAGKLISWCWWRIKTRWRIAELRKKLELGADCKSKSQLDRARRLLALKYHTDKGGDKDTFQEVLQNMEELIELETALSYHKHYTTEDGEETLSWTGYWLVLARMFRKNPPKSEHDLELMSEEMYESGRKELTKEKMESKKNR